MMFRSIGRKLRRAPGRWLAIALAVFMGMSLWSGCLAAGSGLLEGGVRYARRQNLHDFAVTANCGFSEAEVDSLRELEEVAQAEGVITGWGLAEDADGRVKTAALRSVTEIVDIPAVRDGRLPENAGECALDASVYDASFLGTTVILRESGTTGREYTAVGLVTLPEYPGSAPILTNDGSAETFVLLTADAFAAEGWTEVRLSVTDRGSLWSREYQERLNTVYAVLEGAAKTAVYSRHATMLAQVQTELTAKEEALAALQEEYDTGFGDAAAELALLQAEFGAAEAQWLEACQSAAELESTEQALIAEAARIEAEDSAIQRDWLAYEEERDERLLVLDEEKTALDLAHYDMEYAVVDLEYLIGDLENSLYVVAESEHDRIGLEILEHQQEILRLESEYAAMEEVYLANEAAFAAWRTEAVAVLQNRETVLQEDRATYDADMASYETELGPHEEDYALKEEAYLSLKEEAEAAETQLLSDSLELLNEIAAAEAARDAAMDEAEMLQKPVLRYARRSENAGYRNLYTDGTSLNGLLLLGSFVCLLLMIYPCARAAREVRLEEEASRRSLDMMGIRFPAWDCGRCAAVSGAAGGAVGSAVGSILGFCAVRGIYGKVYSVPPAMKLSLIFVLLGMCAVWGILSWGLTAAFLRRLPRKKIRRGSIVPAAEKLHPMLRTVFRGIGSAPGKFVLSALTALCCMALLCTAFSAADSRNADSAEALPNVLVPLPGDLTAERVEEVMADHASAMIPAVRRTVELSVPGARETAELFAADADAMAQLLQGYGLPEETAVLSADTAQRMGVDTGDRVSITMTDGSSIQLPVSVMPETGMEACIVLERSVFFAWTEKELPDDALFIRLPGNADREEIMESLEYAGIRTALQPINLGSDDRDGGGAVFGIFLFVLFAGTAGLFALFTLPGGLEEKQSALLRRQGLSDVFVLQTLVLQTAPAAFPGVLAGLCVSGEIARLLHRAIRYGGGAMPFRLSAGSLVLAAVMTLAAAVGGSILAAYLLHRKARAMEEETENDPKIE